MKLLEINITCDNDTEVNAAELEIRKFIRRIKKKTNARAGGLMYSIKVKNAASNTHKKIISRSLKDRLKITQ